MSNADHESPTKTDEGGTQSSPIVDCAEQVEVDSVGREKPSGQLEEGVEQESPLLVPLPDVSQSPSVAV